MKNIILETKRLQISIPTKASFDNRYKLLSDTSVAKYLGNGKPRTKEAINYHPHSGWYETLA